MHIISGNSVRFVGLSEFCFKINIWLTDYACIQYYSSKLAIMKNFNISWTCRESEVSKDTFNMNVE